MTVTATMTSPHKTPMPGTEPVSARDPGSALAADWFTGGFMQVFVRAYQDSNGDGLGDLRGLTARLDELQDLGVTGLWLMPIHPSSDGDHGYAVTDYQGVDPAYGTLADVDELLRQAHARGIGVILDYVINHSSRQHPLFLAAAADRASPYRRWFRFEDAKPEGWSIYEHDPWRPAPGGGWYFGAFGAGMPDFDWRCPEVEAWHHDNLRFWLNRGVDGFRFDAVGHLVENGPDAWDCQPQNYPIMGRIRALLDGYARRFMVNEAPRDPAGFTRAAGSAFAFDLNGLLIDAARGRPGAMAEVAAYHAAAPGGLATFLSNHDSFAGARVFDQLGGELARCKVAAALLLTLPGVPFVYYGEEIGMAGHPELAPDPALRTPMSWDADGCGFSTAPRPFRAAAPNRCTHNVAAQRGDPDSLRSFYRWLLQLRRAHPALRHGVLEAVETGPQHLAFTRRQGGDALRVVIDAGRVPGVTVTDC